MVSIIFLIVTLLIGSILFKQSKKHDFVGFFWGLTVCGLIIAYSSYTVASSLKIITLHEASMHFSLGLFIPHFILFTLLYFKLVKENKKRLIYSFIICSSSIAAFVLWKTLRGLLIPNYKITANFESIGSALFVIEIASFLFFLTVLIITAVNAFGEWSAAKNRLKLQAEAEAGNVMAQNELGLIYCLGDWVEQDFKIAMEWFEKAADQGDLDAPNNIGIMYQNGQGVEKSYLKAYAWFSVAAANANKLAQEHKGLVVKEMTPEQITKAEELVKEMVKKNPKLIKEKD
tara:strand:+ start:170 stop:1033 length:864 start_codon:yes stop_codon:yes gene_type:complete